MENMNINFPDDLQVLAFLGGGDPGCFQTIDIVFPCAFFKGVSVLSIYLIQLEC